MQEALSFGQWLKDRRRVLGLTQQEMAERATCSLSSLRKIEAGELTPSRELALLLAAALGVSAEEQEAFVAYARDERRATLTPALVTTTALPPVNVSIPAPPPIAAALSPPRRSSLPPQITPFIGREAEVAEVQQLLANPACALLTLVGAGGIGKTRLAIAVAQTILDSPTTEPASQQKSKIQNLKFADGLYFVSFVGVATPDLMVSTIATAIGFSFGGAADPRSQLLNYLAEKRMLLVLDNLEHLLDGVELLTALVQAAPALKLLVTSRERLALQGEWVFELPALATPQQNDDTAMVGDAAYPAVTLFVERAQRTRHGFTLAGENEAAVGQICRLVGGMPLALELAASWTHALSCAEIAEEISRNLDFLTVSRRDLPERQRSMRATFDYSWQLLTGAERRALAQLAVFAGSFTREAAREVAETNIIILGALAAKSLVRRVTTASSDATVGKAQPSRYELHELVRQFAGDKLAEEPATAEETHARHAHYYLHLLASEEAALQSADQQEAQQRLQLDIANLHQAWAWAVAHEQAEWLRQAALPFTLFFELCDDYAGGEALFRRAQEQLQAVRRAHATPLLEIAWAKLVTYQLYFASRRSERLQSLTLLEEAIALLRRHADQASLAQALWTYGVACFVQGQFEASLAALCESAVLSSRHEQPWVWAVNQILLGIVLYEVGDYHGSYQRLADGMAQMRMLGDAHLITWSGAFRSRTLHVLDRHDEMMALLHERLHLAQASGNRCSMALTLEQLALASHAQHQTAAYERFVQEALSLYREMGDNLNLTRLLNQAGMVALEGANDATAQAFFGEALRRALAAHGWANVLNALTGLAMLAMRQGDAFLALTLVEAILLHSASSQTARELAGQVQAELLARLPAAQVEAAQQQAKATPLERLAAEVVKVQVGEEVGSKQKSTP